MKRIAFLYFGITHWVRGVGPAILALALLLSACSPQGAQPQATLEEAQIEAVEDAQRFLAEQLSADMEAVQLEKVEDAQWTDSCLGLPMDGENCTQAITQGFKITFKVDGKQYVVRTDSTGGAVRMETIQE